MEVKAGYKQTEIGVIPKDWEVYSLSEITEPQRPISYGIVQTGLYVTNGIRCLRVLDIHNGQINKNDLITTSKKISDTYRRTVLKEGDLVMPLRGKVGDVGLVDKELAGANLTRGVALIAIRAGWSAPFCKQAISSESTRRRLEHSMNGSALQEIPIATLRSFKIATPKSMPEQQAIANALSDADALIESLEQLIEKKRQIKQGVMQELLTGKRRLPGFSGEWEKKKLSDFGKTFGGLTGKSKFDFENGNRPYVTFMNVMNNNLVNFSELGFVKIRKNENQNKVLKGDLLFNGSSETPEEVGFCCLLDNDIGEIYLNSFCFGFRPNLGAPIDGVYLTYFFRSNEGREILKSLAQGATRYNLSKTAFLAQYFSLPPLLEQKAIGQVLFGVDEEINVFQNKLRKAKLIKQAMMQDLLTGKVRLV